MNKLYGTIKNDLIDLDSTSNRLYTQIVPEKPSILAQERIFVYVPKVGFNTAGIAKFAAEQFNINNGEVSIKPSYLAEALDTEINVLLSSKVDKNANITAGTKTKITFDEKGLVTGGSDLVPSDIGAVEEALNDGKTYARKNKSWVEFQKGFLPDEETITLNNDDELEATNVAIWRYE